MLFRKKLSLIFVLMSLSEHNAFSYRLVSYNVNKNTERIKVIAKTGTSNLE